MFAERGAYLYELLPGGKRRYDVVGATFWVCYWDIEAVSGQTVSLCGENLFYPLPVGKSRHRCSFVRALMKSSPQGIVNSLFYRNVRLLIKLSSIYTDQSVLAFSSCRVTSSHISLHFKSRYWQTNHQQQVAPCLFTSVFCLYHKLCGHTGSAANEQSLNINNSMSFNSIHTPETLKLEKLGILRLTTKKLWRAAVLSVLFVILRLLFSVSPLSTLFCAFSFSYYCVCPLRREPVSS